MTKIMVMPSNKENIKNLIDVSDAFLIGVKNLSVNLPTYFNLDEIKEISSYLMEQKKELFIAVNRNIHNNDLEYLKEVMIKLNEINIKGILYYDIGVVNIYNNLDLNYSLVWAQEHLTTNYYTCNYWKNFGADYTLISSEITLDEIYNIRKNSDIKMIVPIFGYLPMFVSKRHLVKNYLDYFSLKDKSNINYMSKEGNIYPIVDDNNGTTVYSAKILNGLEESLILRNKEIDYLLLNSFDIEPDNFKKIVSIYYNLNKQNLEKSVGSINSIINKPMDKGFLYKETVYRVKSNE